MGRTSPSSWGATDTFAAEPKRRVWLICCACSSTKLYACANKECANNRPGKLSYFSDHW